MDGCPKNVHLVLMGYIRIVYHITTFRSTLFISFYWTTIHAKHE